MTNRPEHSPSPERLDLVVAGGGQAGLAVAREAQALGLSYVVLERGARAGESWRDRYDSLVLFTPRRFSALAGRDMDGSPDAYPTKDDVATYLGAYAEDLRVEFDASVESLERDDEGFTSSLGDGRQFRSRLAIIATGPFQAPRMPLWSTSLGVPAVHSSAYRSPNDLPSGRVLVVGGGNSGAQIAEELAATHDVSLSVSAPMRFVPQRIVGLSIFTILDRLGFLTASTESIRGRLLRRRGDPVFGTGLRRLIAQGRVALRSAAVGADDRTLTFADGSTAEFDAVVFCTGFSNDYSWVAIEGAIEAGTPIQRHGLSSTVRGLGFVGLAWMRSRNSALVGGASADAAYVLGELRAAR